jgi:hypothetical protein
MNTDRARDFNADNRFGIYLRPLGPGWHLIRSSGCPTPIRVASSDPGSTFAPGSQILLGSNAGHPGEVLLGLPPNCRAGSSRFPPLTVSTTMRATIPTPCPKPLRNHDYCAFLSTGSSDGKVHAYLYDDGDYVRKLAELDLSGESGLSTFTITNAQWMDPAWLPEDGTSPGVASESIGPISVTFAAAGITVTRGADSWIDDGVQVGDVLAFDSTTSNDVEIVVTDITDLVVTGRSFDTLVNEGPVSAGVTIIRDGMVYSIPPELRTKHWIIFATTSEKIITWHTATGRYWIRHDVNPDYGVNPFITVVPRGYRSTFFSEGPPSPAVVWVDIGYRSSSEPECPSEQEIQFRCSTIFPWNALTVSGGGGAGGGGNHGSFELPDYTIVSRNVDLEDRNLANGSFMHFDTNIMAYSGQSYDGLDTMYRRLGEGSWVEAFQTGCDPLRPFAWEIGRSSIASRWNNASEGLYTHDGRTVRMLRFGYDENTGPGGIFIAGPDCVETPLWPRAIAPTWGSSQPFAINPNRDQVVLTDPGAGRYLRMQLFPITNEECELPWIDMDLIPEHSAYPTWMYPID